MNALPPKAEAVVESSNSVKRPRVEEGVPSGPNKRPRSDPALTPVVTTTEPGKDGSTPTAPIAAVPPTAATASTSTPTLAASPTAAVPAVPATSPTTKKKANANANAKIPEVVEDVCDLATLRAFEFERVETFGPLMQKRYESYRRSDFRPAKMKKVCTALNPALVKASEHYIIALKGLAKLFVGDVVETALEIRKSLGDSGPLKPNHLREAFRRLRRNGAIPGTKEANFV